MKITDIQQQKKNAERYSVFTDGKYAFSLTADDLLSEGIKLGLELDEPELDRLKRRSSDSLLLTRTIEKCVRRPHSEKEIRDYLRKKRASTELEDAIIERCYKLSLLNDQLFAERWVEYRQKNGKSNRYIRGELQAKGVDRSIVEAVLPTSDQEQLRTVISKRAHRYSDEKKLIEYLQRQGFSYYDIQRELTDEAD